MNKKKYFGYLFIFVTIAALALGAVRLTHNFSNSKSSKAVPPSSSNTTVIDMQHKGLTTVTSDIYNKTATTTLLLSYNSIQTLPGQMGKLTKLTKFKVDHNQLKGNLIGEVHYMTQLQTLDLSYNNMTGIPAEIGQLYSLQTLDYSHNQITGLPDELTNLKNNLKTFNLTNNPLSQSTINKLKYELPNTNVIF